MLPRVILRAHSYCNASSSECAALRRCTRTSTVRYLTVLTFHTVILYSYSYTYPYLYEYEYKYHQTLKHSLQSARGKTACKSTATAGQEAKP